MNLYSGFEQDEELWNLIAKVVSNNASEEEQLKLTDRCKIDPATKNIVEELQAFWKINPSRDHFESEIAFHKLLKKVGSLPD